MPPNKIQRINEDIQRVLASLLRSIKDPRVKQGIISVTAVDTTSDLRHAKVFLSVYELQSEKEFMKGLKSASGFLRHELGQSLTLRYTPELHFELDRSIERGARINTLLNTLDIQEGDADSAGNAVNDTDGAVDAANAECRMQNAESGDGSGEDRLQ